MEEMHGTRSLGRPEHRWEDNIKMFLQAIRWEGVDSINIFKDRKKWQAVVNLVMIF